MNVGQLIKWNTGNIASVFLLCQKVGQHTQKTVKEKNINANLNEIEKRIEPQYSTHTRVIQIR